MTAKKKTINELMYVLIEDQKTLLQVAKNCDDQETKNEIYDFVGTLQTRWDDLYKLTWE